MKFFDQKCLICVEQPSVHAFRQFGHQWICESYYSSFDLKRKSVVCRTKIFNKWTKICYLLTRKFQLNYGRYRPIVSQQKKLSKMKQINVSKAALANFLSCPFKQYWMSTPGEVPHQSSCFSRYMILDSSSIWQMQYTSKTVGRSDSSKSNPILEPQTIPPEGPIFVNGSTTMLYGG